MAEGPQPYNELAITPARKNTAGEDDREPGAGHKVRQSVPPDLNCWGPKGS
jgi:hypothetical protein